MASSFIICRLPFTIVSRFSKSPIRACFWSTSEIISARKRARVNGVLRSCEIAAKSRSRSPVNFWMRPTMVLKARMVATISLEPFSRIWRGFRPLPMASACLANKRRGLTTQRTSSRVRSNTVNETKLILSTRSLVSQVTPLSICPPGITAAR